MMRKTTKYLLPNFFMSRFQKHTVRHHDKPLSHQSDSASCEQNPLFEIIEVDKRNLAPLASGLGI